jgi:putative oxidoreductase
MSAPIEKRTFSQRIGKGKLNVKQQHVRRKADAGIWRRGDKGPKTAVPVLVYLFICHAYIKEEQTMKYLVLLGRALYAAIFVMSGPNHFSAGAIGFAVSKGVPMASIAVPLSGVIALVGGLSILLGYKSKYGAWLIVLFLVPVSFMMHNFWTYADPMQMQMQMAMFMKNMSMLGAALLIAHFGSGPLSLDKK